MEGGLRSPVPVCPAGRQELPPLFPGLNLPEWGIRLYALEKGGSSPMEMELTYQERDCLLEILDTALRNKLTEKQVTSGCGIQRYLEREINLLEGMKSKFLPIEVV
jgi:hypothetical protein